MPVGSSLFSPGCSNETLGSKRAPLPPQQTSFPPPHPISMPSKWPEDNARVAAEDTLPCQPRNSLSTVQPLDVTCPPNSADLHRRPSIQDGASYPDKRANVIRDNSSRPEKRQSGPTERRLPEDVRRPSNIPLDSDGRGYCAPELRLMTMAREIQTTTS